MIAMTLAKAIPGHLAEPGRLSEIHELRRVQTIVIMLIWVRELMSDGPESGGTYSKRNDIDLGNGEDRWLSSDVVAFDPENHWVKAVSKLESYTGGVQATHRIHRTGYISCCAKLTRPEERPPCPLGLDVCRKLSFAIYRFRSRWDISSALANGEGILGSFFLGLGHLRKR